MADSFSTDDAPPTLGASVANPAATLPRTEAELAEARRRYNAAPEGPTTFVDDDPMSPAYARTDIDETPGTVLHFWFGYAADRPALLAERQRLWFRKDFNTDKVIAHRGGDLLAKLSSGEAHRWAAQGPRERLAAVIALDQFSRNIFRDTPASFENDALALELAKAGMARGEDNKLAPIERWFLYMPLEHSESATDQRYNLEKFNALIASVPSDQREAYAAALDFAKRHAAIIRRFGRFPHRNDILGRTTTTAERLFLSRPGSHF
ncbi:MAG: DUF924 family protein [Alphaproteobacteria bacterium]